MGRIAPADYRARATTLLNDLPKYQCADGGFGFWPGSAAAASTSRATCCTSCTSAARLGVAPGRANVVTRALDFLEAELKRDTPPDRCSGCPPGAPSMPSASKVLAEYGRNQDSNITRLSGMADRLPVFALSYLADAMAASTVRGAAVRRRRPPHHERAAGRRRPGARRGARLGRAALAVELERPRDGARARRPRRARRQRRRSCQRLVRWLLAARDERPLGQHAGERDGARSARQLLPEVRERTCRT